MVPTPSVDELRSTQSACTHSWEQIIVDSVTDENYDPEQGETIGIGVSYRVEGREFTLVTRVEGLAEGLTYRLRLRSMCSYDHDLTVEHDTAVDFIAMSLGPIAFTLVNDMLTTLGSKAGAPYPTLEPPSLATVWDHIREDAPVAGLEP